MARYSALFTMPQLFGNDACPSPPQHQPQAAVYLPAASSGERDFYFKGLSAAHKRSGGLTHAKRKTVYLASMFGYDDEIDNPQKLGINWEEVWI